MLYLSISIDRDMISYRITPMPNMVTSSLLAKHSLFIHCFHTTINKQLASVCIHVELF